MPDFAVHLKTDYTFGMAAMPFLCNGILLFQGNLRFASNNFKKCYLSCPLYQFVHISAWGMV